jgi:ROS/MUCR transcriptional regulator protein
VQDRVINLTAQIVSAHVVANEVSADRLPALIRNVHQALATVEQASSNAVRHTEASGVGLAQRSPRHNIFGPGRSSCRSAPASDSPRKGTAALMLPRHEKPTRLVDERHDCQDIGPAYVPGTVWGTASSQTAKFRSRRRACRLIPANYYAPLGSAVSPARSAGQG